MYGHTNERHNVCWQLLFCSLCASASQFALLCLFCVLKVSFFHPYRHDICKNPSPPTPTPLSPPIQLSCELLTICFCNMYLSQSASEVTTQFHFLSYFETPLPQISTYSLPHSVDVVCCSSSSKSSYGAAQYQNRAAANQNYSTIPTAAASVAACPTDIKNSTHFIPPLSLSTILPSKSTFANLHPSPN